MIGHFQLYVLSYVSYLCIIYIIIYFLNQKQNEHCLVLNLTSLQVFCLLCSCEVFLENNDPPIPGMLSSPPSVAKSDTDSDDELDSPDDCLKPKGSSIFFLYVYILIYFETFYVQNSVCKTILFQLLSYVCMCVCILIL